MATDGAAPCGALGAGLHDFGEGLVASLTPFVVSEASSWQGSLGSLADYIGPHKILWATDYPHRDGFFPGAGDHEVLAHAIDVAAPALHEGRHGLGAAAVRRCCPVASTTT